MQWLEKFPKYFFAVTIIYMAVFLLGIAYFIIPAADVGLYKYTEAYLITLLIIAPFILLLAYCCDEYFPRIQEREGLFRAVTAVLMVAAIFFVCVFILPLVL